MDYDKEPIEIKIPIPDGKVQCHCGRHFKWQMVGKCLVCYGWVCTICVQKCKHCGSLLGCHSSYCPCHHLPTRPKPPKLKRDWEGAKVMTRVPLHNRNIAIPQGTICTVERNYGGLKLVTDPCPKCGIGIRITKVSERSVVLLRLNGHE